MGQIVTRTHAKRRNALTGALGCYVRTCYVVTLYAIARGGTKRVALPEILKRIALSELSGSLEATSGKTARTSYFDRGFVVFTASTSTNDRLGQCLLEAGRVTEHELELAARLMSTRGRRIGQARPDSSPKTSSGERVLDAPEDINARSAMQLGAYFAGVTIENSMLGATHACANPLTKNFGIAHGRAISMCLATVVRFNAERYRELSGGAESLARRLEDLAEVAGTSAPSRRRRRR